MSTRNTVFKILMVLYTPLLSYSYYVHYFYSGHLC